MKQKFKILSGCFSPPIDVESEVLATASFRHLEEVFLMELHMPVKLAHKLSHKVLHPGI